MGDVDQACPFCRIVTGGEPAHVVLDHPDAVGFLDARPLQPGHVLVVPRPHRETLLDLAPDELGQLWVQVQRVAAAVERGLGAAGSFVAVNNKVSQSVPHLHVHVVPRRPKDGLKGFFWPRHRYGSDAEAAEVADRLRRALA